MDTDELAAAVKQANVKFKAVKDEIGKVIVGQTEMVDRLLLAILADGHILLEGLPGLAKTLAATTLAKVSSVNTRGSSLHPTYCRPI